MSIQYENAYMHLSTSLFCIFAGFLFVFFGGGGYLWLGLFLIAIALVDLAWKIWKFISYDVKTNQDTG
jgi:hypothetical protein